MSRINASPIQVLAAEESDGTELLTSVLDLFSMIAILGGSVWLIWGVVVLAGGLKDHNGPQIQSGVWQIVGGVMIVIAAGLFKGLAIPAF